MSTQVLARPTENKQTAPDTRTQGQDYAFAQNAVPYEFASSSLSRSNTNLRVTELPSTTTTLSSKELVTELKTLLDKDTFKLFQNLLNEKPEILLKKDSQGVKFIDRLGEIATSQISSELIQGLEMNRRQIQAELVKNLLEKVATNGYAEQSDKATCTACSAETKHFQENPAEFARIISEWSRNGRAILQSGVAVDLSIRDVIKTQNEGSSKYPGRNLIDRMYQESACKWMSQLKEWGGVSYDSSTTTWTDYNGNKFQGFYAQQQQLWDQAFTGRSSTLVFKETDGVEYTTQQIRHSLTQPEGKNGILVFVNWDVRGGHAQHAVTVNEIFEVDGKSYVYFMNGHHDLNNGPERELLKMAGKVYGKTEILPLEKFQELFIHACIPDSANNQKSLTSFTADPAGFSYNYPVIDGTTILNAGPMTDLDASRDKEFKIDTGITTNTSTVLSAQVSSAAGITENAAPSTNTPADLMFRFFRPNLEAQLEEYARAKPRVFIDSNDILSQPPIEREKKDGEPVSLYFSEVSKLA